MNRAAKYLRKRAEELRGYAEGSDLEAKQYDEIAAKERDSAADLRSRADEYEAAANLLDPPTGDLSDIKIEKVEEAAEAASEAA